MICARSASASTRRRSHQGPATARCLILVTPDAQRTMNTYLGACVELGPEDIDATLLAAAQVTYLEGYLFDPPRAKAAFRQAAEIAHKAGRKVSLSLSDPFCVERHRADFRDLVHDHVDILFANEAEICSLYETEDFDDALAAVRGQCEIAALTRSAKGSVIVTPARRCTVAAAPVAQVVDTTGAGDLYAARLPLRLDPRPRPRRLRHARQPLRRRDHQPFRCPPIREELRESRHPLTVALGRGHAHLRRRPRGRATGAVLQRPLCILRNLGAEMFS